MALHRIRKGLNLPIAGAPERVIEPARPVRRVAVMAADFPGLKPTMRVKVGDSVRRGQPLFEDKKISGVVHTAPGAGKVLAINRGERRALQSVVIELNESERSGNAEPSDLQRFGSFAGKTPAALSDREIQALLIESGMWTAFRTRPFSRVPNPEKPPRSIFVTAMDTNPLAGPMDLALYGLEEDFGIGLEAVSRLTEGPTFVCQAPGASIPVPSGAQGRVRIEEFEGPHPAGLPGLHIHLLDPVNRNKTVWHLSGWDVAAIGELLRTGVLPVRRVIALGGPSVKRPRLVATRAGACVEELVAGELDGADNRVIAGSVLSGRTAVGDVHGFLGRYHLQISALPEGRTREFLGWAMPGVGKFSTIPAFLSAWLPGRRFQFNTNRNGSPRAMVPIGMYERVMPMDILPTFLLRSLMVGDLDRAEELGALELDEEDLALCSFVCPGKMEYGPILRRNLEELAKEIE